MKKKRLLTLMGSICLTLVLVALLLPACAKEEAPVTPTPAPAEVFNWKLAQWLPSSTTSAPIINWWCDTVEERTNGRLKIKVFWGGQLAESKETLGVAQSGLADMAWVCATYMPGELPLSLVVALPFLPPEADRADWLLWSITKLAEHPYIKEEFDRWNVVHLYTQAAPNRDLMSTVPIRSLDDLKGRRIKCEGQVAKVLAKFGAIPVAGISLPELYSALDTGILDTAAYALGVCNSYKLYEILKYFTSGVNTNCVQNWVLANKDSWNALPDDIKGVIKDLKWETNVMFQTTLYKPDDIKKIHEKFEGAGVEFIEFPPAERAKLLAESQDIWDAWAESVGGDNGRELMSYYIACKEEVIAKYPEGLPKTQPSSDWYFFK